MTENDFSVFAKLLGTVAVAASRDLDDPTIDVFYKALKDIPIELLKLATPVIIREHTDRFPTIPTWRRVVDEVQERGQDELKQLSRKEAQRFLPPVQDPNGDYVPTFACGDCRDTGWRPDCGCSVANLFTAADEPSRMGECRFHGGREANGRTYGRAMQPCSCRDSNPVYRASNPEPIRRYSKPKKGD